MGLLDIFSEKYQNFNEYLYSISDSERLELINSISRYGDPNKILIELMNAPTYCSNNELEVRITNNFLLKFKKKKSNKSPQSLILKMDHIRYCYHSYSKKEKINEVGLLTPFGPCYISLLKATESLVIYRELQKYVHGFDKLPTKAINDEDLLPSFNILHNYFFKDNTLYMQKTSELRKKKTDSIKIQNIQEIIWCEQYTVWDSEGSNTYELKVYLLSQKKPLSLYSTSELGAFLLAIELKKRVPHLLYGPSEKYKEIFKRSPAELMALAKNKTNQQS